MTSAQLSLYFFHPQAAEEKDKGNAYYRDARHGEAVAAYTRAIAVLQGAQASKEEKTPGSESSPPVDLVLLLECASEARGARTRVLACSVARKVPAPISRP